MSNSDRSADHDSTRCLNVPPQTPALARWCPWPDSNQHSLRNSILSRARLPISPQGPADWTRCVAERGMRRKRLINCAAADGDS